MDRIIRNRLITSIISSIIFIIGIISFVLGIKLANSILVVVGIAIIVLGIYLLPLVWFNYIAWVQYKKMYNEIIKKDSITTFELASILNKKDKDITKAVRLLIDNELLSEYRFLDNSKLVKIKNNK